MSELKAGRELDALVAEKVMGWTLADRKAMGWSAFDDVWITGEDFNDPNSSPTRTYFHPSTDIAAAWLVVEKMQTLGYEVRGICSICNNTMWRATFDIEKGYTFRVECEEEGDTAPLAICRAALKAVGHDA